MNSFNLHNTSISKLFDDEDMETIILLRQEALSSDATNKQEKNDGGEERNAGTINNRKHEAEKEGMRRKDKVGEPCNDCRIANREFYEDENAIQQENYVSHELKQVRSKKEESGLKGAEHINQNRERIQRTHECVHQNHDSHEFKQVGAQLLDNRLKGAGHHINKNRESINSISPEDLFDQRTHEGMHQNHVSHEVKQVGAQLLVDNSRLKGAGHINKNRESINSISPEDLFDQRTHEGMHQNHVSHEVKQVGAQLLVDNSRLKGAGHINKNRESINSISPDEDRFDRTSAYDVLKEEKRGKDTKDSPSEYNREEQENEKLQGSQADTEEEKIPICASIMCNLLSTKLPTPIKFQAFPLHPLPYINNEQPSGGFHHVDTNDDDDEERDPIPVLKLQTFDLDTPPFISFQVSTTPKRGTKRRRQGYLFSQAMRMGRESHHLPRSSKPPIQNLLNLKDIHTNLNDESKPGHCQKTAEKEAVMRHDMIVDRLPSPRNEKIDEDNNISQKRPSVVSNETENVPL